MSSGATRRGHDGFAPLPRGARDLLPAAQRRRRALTGRLLGVFERWGYDAIATPAVEYFEVFGRGLGERERARCVRFISPDAGELVTLRSDVTPQIARLAGQRLGDRLRAGECLRLAYAADVVRLPDGPQAEAEHHQIGVELLGDAAPAADAEVIALAHEALTEVGLGAVQIDLAHVGVARAVLDRLDLDLRRREELVVRLGRKDVAGVAGLLAEAGVAADVRRQVCALSELYGDASILRRAREVLPGAAVWRALDELEAVIATLSVEDTAAAGRLSVDLGEVRGFDYYTGVRLRVWAAGSPRPIVLGGRYDHLVGRYGVDAAATGFAIDIEALEAALPGGEGELGRGVRGVLVAVEPGAGADARAVAASLARQARAEGERAWVQPALGLAEAQAAAERAGARLVHITVAGGAPRPSRWRRDGDRWREGESR